ncbi:MAG: gamma carbonic anhydrase family protein [Dehalococcoidia bacterium]|nr:gamma carbonic anhydrase family protein [Dehalococcoidia bacterium]
MIRTLDGVTPKVADTAWVSEFAYVVGNVEIGEYASIWPGVTVRGDSPDAVVIGDYVNIQEGSVIHGNGLTIEDHVSVGHSVVVHCERVGRGSLLGNNCTILNQVVLGENCLVAANSVVLGGSQVPARSFVTGAPGQVKREVSDSQISQMAHTNEELVKRAKSFKDSGL